MFTLALLSLSIVSSPFAAQVPSETSSGDAVEQPATPPESGGSSSSEEPTEEKQEEAPAPKKKEESVFERLTRDPYERRYGHPPGDGWIPMPGTRTELRFGGFVQLNVIYDFENTGFPFGDFIPSLIPVPTDDTPNTEFDARASRVTFETRTNVEKAGSVNTMISMDFAGDESETSIQPRLRQAYVMWVGPLSNIAYTAGQTWTTFMDLGVWPEIFDLEGPNAMTGLRQGLLRGAYAFEKDNRLVFDFSLEQPETLVENGNGLRDGPDVAARLNWQPDWGHLQAAGVGRRLVAESASGTGRDTAYGWGLSFSGSWLVPGTKRKDAPSDNLGARQDQVQFQAQLGSGIGRYVFDPGSAPTPQDAVYDAAAEKIIPLDEIGAFVAYHHWWTNEWRSELVYGLIRMDNLTIQPSTELQRATYALANLLYRPFRRMDVGLEYYWGERENKDGETGHANRLMFVVNFGF